MTLYTYAATDSHGAQRQGTFEAASAERAREMLAGQGMRVIAIHESTAVDRARCMQAPVAAATMVRAAEDDAGYMPLLDTMRLYAGWLLAWYAAVYLLGFYRLTDRLSVDLPFIEELFQSELVLHFAFGTFLFLLLSGLLKFLRGGMMLSLLIAVLGVCVFLVFSANV